MNACRVAQGLVFQSMEPLQSQSSRRIAVEVARLRHERNVLPRAARIVESEGLTRAKFERKYQEYCGDRGSDVSRSFSRPD